MRPKITIDMELIDDDIYDISISRFDTAGKKYREVTMRSGVSEHTERIIGYQIKDMLNDYKDVKQ